MFSHNAPQITVAVDFVALLQQEIALVFVDYDPKVFKLAMVGVEN